MSTLVLLAHPDLAASRGNVVLAAAAHDVTGVTVHDLYAAYPDGKVDVEAEKALVDSHDCIVFQFPLHWYSVTPILKMWMDDVLEMGWAYNPLDPAGPGLLGEKTLSCAITTGAPQSEYGAGGWNTHSVDDFLAPLKGTAQFCAMAWQDPYVTYGVFGLTDDDIAEAAAAYQDWLRAK